MKNKKKDIDPYPLVIEAFHPPIWELQNIASIHNTPIAFNENVRVHKYRITAERVDEPIEVIRERIQKLWDECDNHHHLGPLQNAAEKAGFKLEFPSGKNRRPR